MKKNAFSYLELIISMGLVTMVVFLTTPFLIHLEKSSTARFGEFRAYAKYLNADEYKAAQEADGGKYKDCLKEDFGWVLFQNVRRGQTEYNMEDKPCGCVVKDSSSNIQACSFILPRNITSYKVHLFGAGGTGSKPEFDDNLSNDSTIYYTQGGPGKKGRSVTMLDNLKNALISTDDIERVDIYNCNDVRYTSVDIINTTMGNLHPKNCIGTDPLKSDTGEYMYTHYITGELKKRAALGIFSESDLAYANAYFSNPDVPDILKNFVGCKNKNSSDPGCTNYTTTSIFNMIVNNKDTAGNPVSWNSVNNVKPVNIKNIGISGGNSFFYFANDNKPTIASGGEGGVTDDRNSESVDVESLEESSGSYTINGVIGDSSSVSGEGGAGGDCKDSNCNGYSPIVNDCAKDNKIVPCDSESGLQKLYRFGAGGGSGALRVTNSEGVMSLDTAGEGGRGAGGAVVIEWN